MSRLSSFYPIGDTSGGTGGGLSWSIETTNKTTESGLAYLMDTSSGSLTVTLHSSPEVGDEVAVADLKGTFDTNSVTISKNSMLIQGLDKDLLLDVKNQRVTLVYSGATDGWIITEMEPNISQFEYMPYAVMHVQDQRAYNVEGGTSVGDAWTTRTLNTVLQNDITGASLSNNGITLPAGTYYVDGSGYLRADAGVSFVHSIFTSSGRVLMGITDGVPLATGASTVTSVRGTFTLSEQDTIYLKYYVGIALATYALGRSNNTGSITDPTIPSIYADLKITKIGGNYAPKPVITSARYEPMAGLSTTGGVMGFDISKTGANQVTVTKGVCLDSNLAVALTLTADTALSIPAVANTIYHIFVVRLVSNGLFTVKAYTTEAAVASDTDVNAFRWIGFWRTNGSTECIVAHCTDGVMIFGKASENRFASALTTSYITLDHSSFLPTTRIKEILYGSNGSAGSAFMMSSLDGVNMEIYHGYETSTPSDASVYAWGNAVYQGGGYVPWKSDRYFAAGTAGGTYPLIHGVKLRR